MRKDIKEFEKLALKEVLQNIEVVCCTNSGAGDKILEKNIT